jgi:hypothetical protein
VEDAEEGLDGAELLLVARQLVGRQRRSIRLQPFGVLGGKRSAGSDDLAGWSAPCPLTLAMAPREAPGS